MNPAMLLKFAELALALAQLAPRLAVLATQLSNSVALVQRLQREGRDPTPEELATLDAEFQSASADLSKAIAARERMDEPPGDPL